jgi:hypothetical protein
MVVILGPSKLSRSERRVVERRTAPMKKCGAG